MREWRDSFSEVYTYSCVSGDVLGELHADLDRVERVADQGLHETSRSTGNQVGKRGLLVSSSHCVSM